MICESQYDRRRFCRTLGGLLVPIGFPAIIRAASFSDSLAFRSQGSGISFNAATLDWATRVQANGDPYPSGSVLSAVNAWSVGLVTDGIESLIYYDLIFMPGSSQITSLTPFHKQFGTDPATVIGSPARDASGYMRFSGAGIGLHTGVSPSNVFTNSDMGLAIYEADHTGVAVSQPAQWGGGGNSSRFGYFWTTSLASYTAFGISFTNPTSVGQWGFWLGSRTGATQTDVYCANGSVPWANVGTSASTGTAPTSGNISYCDNAAATFLYNFSGDFGTSYLGIVKGMSTAQGQKLFNRTQALRQNAAVNGGFT